MRYRGGSAPGTVEVSGSVFSFFIERVNFCSINNYEFIDADDNRAEGALSMTAPESIVRIQTFRLT